MKVLIKYGMKNKEQDLSNFIKPQEKIKNKKTIEIIRPHLILS